MNYQSLRQLLTDMGIWSPLRPGPRNKTLRWEDEQGKRIPGVYLNETETETDTDTAYFTLNSACVLNEDENLWTNLHHRSVAEVDKANRNIYPLQGKEEEALDQLFVQSMEEDLVVNLETSCGISFFDSILKDRHSLNANAEVYVCDRAPCGYRFSDTSGVGHRFLWPIGLGLPLTVFSVALFFGAFWPPSFALEYLLLANIPVWLCVLGLRSLTKLGSAVCPSCHRGVVLCSVHDGNRGKTALAVSLQRYPGSG